MTKKQVIEILKGMDCEIAQVAFKFKDVNNGSMVTTDVLVYLVDQPSNDDQIINSEHWFIFDINEFEEYNFIFYGKDAEFIDVAEFVSDFNMAKDDKKIDPVQDQTDDVIKTIQWYKVKCSFFKQEFGVRNWTDLLDFMQKTIGFDYTITGQYTKPYTGVEGYYENGQIFKL